GAAAIPGGAPSVVQPAPARPSASTLTTPSGARADRDVRIRSRTAPAAQRPDPRGIDTPVPLSGTQVPRGIVFLSLARYAQSAPRSSPYPSIHQHDGIDVAAVIGLRPMGRAAIAEKAIGLRIGAQCEVIDGRKPSAPQAHCDVTAEVEHGMTVARGGGKETSAVCIV